MSLSGYELKEDLKFVDLRLKYEYLDLSLRDRAEVWRAMDNRPS